MKTKYQVELVITEPEKISMEERFDLMEELQDKIHAIRFDNMAARFIDIKVLKI